MNRIFYLLIVSISLFCTSCNTPTHSVLDLYSNTSSRTPVIKIHGCDFDRSKELPKNLDFRFSELYSNVEYIKLEDTEVSSLGEVASIQITKDNDFIVFDSNNKKILRFDATGKFTNAIGCQGKAKNEYQNPSDVKYDPFNNQVAVLDNSRGRILFYNLDGTFVHHLVFDFPFLTFGIIDKDLIVLYRNEVGDGRTPDMDYNFQIYNREGVQMKAYQPFNEMHNIRVAGNTFSLQNNRLIGNERYSPVIFTFNKTELVPLYYLDFGNQQIPKSVLDEAKNLIDLRKGWLKKNDWTICMKFFESPTKLILRLSKKNLPLHYIVDKKKTDNYFVKAHAFNDLYGKVDKNFFDFSYDNKIVYVIDSEIAKNALESINNNRSEYENPRASISETDLGLLNELSKHTNPILQICTLKE